MLLQAKGAGFFLDVKVTPQSRRDEVAGIRNGALVVKTTAAPDKGKANAALIALLAKSMGIPKSALQFFSGETDRNKVVRFAFHAEAAQTWLTELELRQKQFARDG
jgi:uncharacterized protein